MVGLEGQHRGLASALTFKASSTKCLCECNREITGSLEADLKETLLSPGNSPGSSVSVDITKSAHWGVDLHAKSPGFWDGMSCKCQQLPQIMKLYSSFFLERVEEGRVTLGYEGRLLWRPGGQPCLLSPLLTPQAHSLILSQVPLAGLPYKCPQEPPQDHS